MADDPFDTADDLNPFAQVNDYNPFSNAAQHYAPASQSAVPNTTPQLKFREEEKRSPPKSASGGAGSYGSTQLGSGGGSGGGGGDDDFLGGGGEEGSDDEGVGLEESLFKSEADAEDSHTVGLLSTDPQSYSTPSGARVTVQHRNTSEKKYKFYQLEYYQQFFNVDSVEVGRRCLRAMWPFKNDFLETIKKNPDFFGPFWISTTLAFMVAAAANFASYLEDPASWHYDVMKLSVGAGVVLGYTFLVPLVLWFYLRWIDIKVRLIETFCIYGYSLFIYLPISVLVIIPFNWIKWVFFAVGMVVSTGFLVVNLWMPLRGKIGCALLLLTIITVLHCGLALFMRLLFCYTPNGGVWTCA